MTKYSQVYTLKVIPLQSINELSLLLAENSIIARLPLKKFIIKKNYRETYTIEVLDSHIFRGKSPSYRMAQLAKKRKRGLTLEEGIALAIQHPEVLDEHAIDMVGSGYGLECIPTVYKWDGQTYLSAICPDVRDIYCAAPQVERELPPDPGNLP